MRFPALVPKVIQDQLNAQRQKVISGAIKVNTVF